MINDYPLIMVLWNLFLAILPFGFFWLLKKYWQANKFKTIKNKVFAATLFCFWVLFIPNAAYLINDIRHLENFCPTGSAIDVCPDSAWQIMFFFIYGATGWVLLFVLLKKMADFIKVILNKKVAIIFLVIIIPFISLGVLLGLLDRFNSWDIFVNPLAIFKNMLRYITDWDYFIDFIVFTSGFYLLYFGGNSIFKAKKGK